MFPLEDYLRAGIVPAQLKLIFWEGRRRRAAGPGKTSAGKTTLTDALLAEIAESEDRVVPYRRSARAAVKRLRAVATAPSLRQTGT
ncbi:hypothetical protein [Pseudorhodoplanes sinuspersici]|uniref:Uncharacterized protein n=1 Tax=Pseudorhodoplanes sinuspersici TaxID=1235591 RepID=A0A1W6ZKU7_9HYPH|nr:hypothetical protein [Pseudorhodoplanes sinuspersici]ARP98038.1 hypothetical protein CAK95_02300 [Pseudorhodoplanes sinuspersici]